MAEDSLVEWFEQQLYMTDPPSRQLPVAELQVAGADPPVDGSSPSLVEARKAVVNLRCAEAPGTCNISAKLLKARCDVLISGVFAVLIAIWQSGSIPPNWTREPVVPKWKGKGNQQDCNNYRDIKLPSVPGKVYALLLQTRNHP